MKLTKSCEYALRIVLYLGKTDQKVTNQELSDTLYIPYHNLTKLIQQLSKAGVVKSFKGKYGGNQLRIQLEELTLKDIIDIIDGPTELSECLSNEMACSLFDACQLKHTFKKVQLEINSVLEAVNLAALK